MKIIDALTFRGLVDHGVSCGANIVNGMPWSFSWKGHNVTHENDECYILSLKGADVYLTPQRVLVTTDEGKFLLLEAPK